MLRILIALWNDDAGFIVSAELILIATILIIGLVVGLVELQASILHELNDVGEAIGSLNQSFSFPGTKTTKGGHRVFTSGSAFTDMSDESCCDCNPGASLFCGMAVEHEGGNH